jgi:poly-gamma-glutamate capsule biosynthesis protein CapA/YwtB (metallophosphatase superfamily)
MMLVLIAACSSRPPQPAPPEPPPPPPPLPGVYIAAVGDIMLGTDYPENILPDDDGVGFLREVTPILQSADVTFGNLEGVLMDGGEAVKQCQSSTACFVFRSPTRYATYLREAGFDVMSLANNHAQDFGDPGRDSSMQALDQVGILHSGRDGDVAEWQARGRRMAMIAFAPNVGSHQLNERARARELVSGLAARNDIVIVSFHGGAEGENVGWIPFTREFYQGEDRGNVVGFARAMVDAGADLVLGHGPHVLRPMELYRDRLIAYSLGNFATYYGISVTGIRGIAAILMVRVDDDGKFLAGHIEPTIQLRPAGPSIDPARQAIEELRWRTEQSFPWGPLSIGPDGKLVQAETGSPLR